MSEEARGNSKRSHPRHRYRAMAHDNAHAAAAAQPPTSLPDHPLVPREPAILITAPDDLATLIEHIKTVGSFAYDSEFIGEMSYFPKLCLLQVATRQRVALVDPLADLDLTSFWELVCDPKVEKIVHAGQQDLEPVIRILGKSPTNLFDTQIAAGFMALSYPPALSKLARHLLGVHMGKGFTFTHWDQRPLTSVQLRYAADDVRFLPAIRDIMGKRLEELGHAAWVTEESESLADRTRYEFDRETDYLKLRGVGSMAPQSLAIVRELMHWRDEGSREADLPPRSFLRDEVLIELARRPVKEVTDLKRIKGLPKPVEDRHGQAIVDATKKAMTLPPNQWPAVKANDESPAEKFKIDALWASAQGWCMGRSIDPAIVVGRQDLSNFYRLLNSGQSLDEHRLMRGWRREAVGDLLVNLVRGKGAMHVQWEAGAMQSTPVQPANKT